MTRISSPRNAEIRQLRAQVEARDTEIARMRTECGEISRVLHSWTMVGKSQVIYEEAERLRALAEGRK